MPLSSLVLPDIDRIKGGNHATRPCLPTIQLILSIFLLLGPALFPLVLPINSPGVFGGGKGGRETMVTDPGSADRRELSRRLRASIDMRPLDYVSRTAAPTTAWMRGCCTDHV